MMNMATTNTILLEHLEAYCRGSRSEKTAILTHLAAVTRLHRKALIRRLGQLARRSSGRPLSRPGPPVQYGPAVTIALRDVWLVFDQPCAERLAPQLLEYVRVLRAQNSWPHTIEATAQLLGMSLGTLKRRIATLRTGQAQTPVGLPATKPSDLKELIPIRRGPWEDPPPGYAEVDTVAHCGPTLQGDFAYTVQTTDVATLWAGLEAQLNKGQQATVRSLERLRRRSPFPWRGLDPDSGSEFVNWHCKEWADKHGIALSRTRPYRKNDHARIEQKNYANVRQAVGYWRYDRLSQVALLGELYAVLEDYLNFFVGSQKCVAKERVGNRYRRRYDKAKPAYFRVLEDDRVDETTKERLRAKYATLDPRAMRSTIDRLATKLMESVKR